MLLLIGVCIFCIFFVFYREINKEQNLGSAGLYIQNYIPVVSDGIVATSSDFFGDVRPNINDAYSLGSYDKSWRNIFTSGTAYVSNVIINGSGTSTFAGTTLHIGTAGAAGAGGCIPMVANDGVTIYMFFSNLGDHYELSTSTSAGICY
jgi:hypothetical protein